MALFTKFRLGGHSVRQQEDRPVVAMNYIPNNSKRSDLKIEGYDKTVASYCQH